MISNNCGRLYMEDLFGKCLNNWGFTRDPFSEAYPYYEDFWAMPRKDIDYIEYLLNSVTNQKEVLNILLQGEYGSGKTYALKFLQSYVERKLNGLGIYFTIQPKLQSRGFLDIHKNILNYITAERISSIGQQLIKENNIQNEEDFKAYLREFIKNEDLIKAISNLSFKKDIALTWMWLKGSATYYQYKSIGFDEAPKDESVSLEIITDLIEFILKKYDVVVILIDELENIRGESMNARSIREGMRNLYDLLIYGEHSKNIAIVGAVTAELVYEMRASLGTPLLDRVDHEFKFTAITEEDAINFVKKIFSWASAIGRSEFPFSPPFMDESAFHEYVNQSTNTEIIAGLGKPGNLTPRRLVKVGKELFRRSCYEKQKTIKKDYIKNQFERENHSERA
jgi:uncharacterized protein YaaR (DUF327 family)